MSKIYLTSDLHFYHANVIKYCSRPYQDVNEMNEALIANWNAVVNPEDTVYCLGDFSLSHRAVEVISLRLNGNKILVPGNHDFCHSYHKKGKKNLDKWKQFYADNGWFVESEQATLNVPGVAVFNLCHHPIEEWIEQDKYADWRPIDDGRILLCGHVHEKWRTAKTSKGTLMINVGVDVWNMKPVSIQELKLLIDIDARREE